MKQFISRWKKDLSSQLSEKQRNEALAFSRDQFHVDYFEDRQRLIEAADLKLSSERSPEDFLILASDAHRNEDSFRVFEYGFAGLALDPEDKRVRAALINCLGIAFKSNGAKELALENFDQAISLDPKNPDPLCHIGELYFDMERFEEAEVKLMEAVQIDPMSPDYHFQLGRVMLARKLYNRAETELQEAVRLDPSRIDIWMGLACLFLEQNKYHQALEPLDRAMELVPDDPEPRIKLGYAQYKLKNFAVAESHFKEAKQLDSKNANICNLLGDVYFDQKKFFQAESEYLQSVGLDSKHAVAYKNLGHVYFEQKKYEQAEIHFQKSIRLDPVSVASLIKIRIRPQFELDLLPQSSGAAGSA